VNKRQFVTLLGGAAAAWPLAARAQQPTMPVIGYLSGRSPEAEGPILAALRRGLEETGYLADRNIAIEFRFSDGQEDQLPALAAELVRRRVAVLVATDRPSALAAKAATSTIPIVFASGLDSVELRCQPEPARGQRDRRACFQHRAWAEASGTASAGGTQRRHDRVRR
jgi:putative tryptophan/tyrosine transport system substrate-binding protein